MQQVSGSNHEQLNGLLKCSGQFDKTATQEYTVRVMYNANNTPRYMQTACNHMQVDARYDRSPTELVPDCYDSHRAALMADLMTLITICSARPTEQQRKCTIL